jgi:hypothetical protein
LIDKTKPFARFAEKAEIDDAALCSAVAEAERGLVGANLGGGVIKQRVARRGQGKSGGFRTLIVFRAGWRSVFVYGFAKSARDNIDPSELAALKKLAGELLALNEKAIGQLLDVGTLVEVICGEKAIS